MLDTYTVVLRRALLQDIMFDAAGQSWTLNYWNTMSDDAWWREMTFTEQSKKTIEKVIEGKFASFAGCHWGGDPIDRLDVLITDRNEGLMFKLGLK